MNTSLRSILLLCVFGVGHINGFDFIKERYNRYMAGGAAYQALQDKKKAGQCEILKTKPAVLRVFAEKVYETPWWVRALNRVSPNESLFTYAQSVYRVIINALDVVEAALLKDIPTISGDLKSDLDFVLTAAKPFEDTEDFRIQIEGNVNRAKDILDRYERNVKSSGASQDIVAALVTKISKAREAIIKAQETRLSWLERLHREWQVERVAYYVKNYCNK